MNRTVHLSATGTFVAGADVEKETRSAQTPLLAATREGNIEAVKALLDAGADPEKESRDGLTPVQLAEETGHSEVYSLLMQAVVGRSADQVLEESAGRMAAAAADREEWHKKSLEDLEERLQGLRQERDGKVEALKAENDELRRKFGLT